MIQSERFSGVKVKFFYVIRYPKNYKYSNYKIDRLFKGFALTGKGNRLDV